MDRYKCEDCFEVIQSEAILFAENPFEAGDQITGCPYCKAIDSFIRVCDEPGCNSFASCGTPTPTGYRNTCFKHMPAGANGEGGGNG